MHTLNRSRWRVLVALTLLWVSFTIIWASVFVVVPLGSSRGFETTKFVFLSLSAFGVLFSSLLSSFNSLEATANIQDRLAFDRVENAFSYMLRWDSQALADARDYTRQIGREQSQLSPEQLCSRIEGVPAEYANPDQRNLQRSVITMVNFFEEIELSIQSGRVDREVLRKAFGVTYPDIYSRFLPWIRKFTDKDQQELLATLARRWQ